MSTRTRTRLAVAILVLCLTTPSSGQPVADATEALHRARARLIGDENRGFSTVLFRLRGERDSAAEHQGFTPADPLLSPFSGAILVDFDNGAAVSDGRSLRSDGSVRWRRAIFDGADGVINIDLTERWSGARSGAPIDAERLSVVRRNPLALLSEITDTRLEEHREIDGQRYVELTAALPDGARLTMLFDAATYDLRSVQQHIDVPTIGDSVVTWRFDEFKPVDGAGVWPHRSQLLLQDRAFLDLAMTVEIDSDSASSLMELPEEIRPPGPARAVSPPPTATPPPRLYEVSPAVWVIPSIRPGFNVMFVEFEDFVVAVDAPAGYPLLDEIPVGDVAPGESSDSISERFIEVIHRTVPDKPIRYVVVSHFHSDHAGGVRAFIAEGATVITTRDLAPFFESIADAPHTIAADRLSREPQPLSMHFVDGEFTVTDGARDLVIHEVDGNPHADGLLVVWLPDEQVLFAPDMFYPTPLEHFPPHNRIPIMQFFVEWMDDAGIQPEQIHSSHGSGIGGPEHVARIRALTENESENP